MTSLREAAQQALEALDSLWQRGVWGDFHGVADNLRAALAEPAQEPQCNPHPKAPHSFMRNASHNEDRYVCECEGWEPYEAGYQAGMEAALAEPAQEPVAWMVYTLDGKSVCVTDNPADFTDDHKVLPLYTAPPQRTPLTDGQIHDCFQQKHKDKATERRQITRAIERVHGIGSQDD